MGWASVSLWLAMDAMVVNKSVPVRCYKAPFDRQLGRFNWRTHALVRHLGRRCDSGSCSVGLFSEPLLECNRRKRLHGATDLNKLTDKGNK